MTRSKSKKRTQLIAAPHQRRAALQAGTSGREKKGAAEPLSTASIPTNEPCSESPPTSGSDSRRALVLAGLLLAVFVWSYWPGAGRAGRAMERIPDYSHGYLVGPIALLMLWARRDRRPEPSAIVAWSAPGLIVAAAVMRYFAAAADYPAAARRLGRSCSGSPESSACCGAAECCCGRPPRSLSCSLWSPFPIASKPLSPIRCKRSPRD